MEDVKPYISCHMSCVLTLRAAPSIREGEIESLLRSLVAVPVVPLPLPVLL